MPFKQNILYGIAFFIYINFVNIYFLILRISDIVTIRPIIVYEYFILGLLLVCGVTPMVIWTLLILTLCLDLINHTSTIFLFNAAEFTKTLEFTWLYKFTTIHYLLAILFIVILYLNFLAIKFFRAKISRTPVVYIGLYLSLLLVFFGADYLNGGSSISDQKRLSISKFNIAGSMIKNWVPVLFELTKTPQKPIFTNSSVTFETFVHDTTSNQFLIILESWGLPKKMNERQKFQANISAMATLKGWTIHFDSTAFKGSTTHAELRELMSVSGDYRYFLNKDSALHIPSIFTLKKQQGYFISAAHSFSRNMFNRSIWWRNIGIDSAYFLEDIAEAMQLGNDQLNYSTPFISLNDEDAFLFLQQSISNEKKNFVYLLTENSHLPFHMHTHSVNSNQFTPLLSEEANNQIIRIHNLILFYIENSDTNQWSKILIVGDHIPPFTNNSDRSYYSSTKVPYILLTRR